MFALRKIVSGGQTGVDRAALDFALESGLEIGGYIPKDRQAEDGQISYKYPNLIETGSEDPAERTELNVKISDATLILSQGTLTGGSKLTKEFAEKHQKPFIHIDLSHDDLKKAKDWLDSIECGTLNIAGFRASEEPEIYLNAKRFLIALFGK